jgi:hypothetical protein
MTQNAKGPASVGALPSHDSTNPQKDTEMNSMDTTTAAPAAASEVMPKTIHALYALWRERRDFDPHNTASDAAKEASYNSYRSLQVAIEGARPSTAVEFAMKFVAVTDDGDSDYPDELIAEAKLLAGGDGSPPSLYSLFALYWTRYAVLDQAMKRTDATEYDTPEHDAALELQTEFGEHLNDVLLEICAFRPRLRFEARFKAEFLTSIVAGDCGKLEADAMAALLSSLPDLVLWSSHQGMEVGQ